MKRFIGIGDIVLDIYYDKENNVLGYYPGSSVWNDLINLKKIDGNISCECIATVGNDEVQNFIFQELSKCGIYIGSLKVIEKQVKRISVITNGEESKSVLECPCCKNKIWYSGYKLPNIIEEDYQLNQDDIGIVIIQSIRSDIIQKVKQLKKLGWKIALDLGYVSGLRFLKIEYLKSIFDTTIDYFQTKPKVLRYMMQRFEFSSIDEVIDILGCKWINITNAEKGSVLIYRKNNRYEKAQCVSPSAIIVDTTGAGDAFFSVLLKNVNCNGAFVKDVSLVQKEANEFAAKCMGKTGATGQFKNISLFDSCTCNACGYKLNI